VESSLASPTGRPPLRQAARRRALPTWPRRRASLCACPPPSRAERCGVEGWWRGCERALLLELPTQHTRTLEGPARHRLWPRVCLLSSRASPCTPPTVAVPVPAVAPCVFAYPTASRGRGCSLSLISCSPPPTRRVSFSLRAVRRSGPWLRSPPSRPSCAPGLGEGGVRGGASAAEAGLLLHSLVDIWGLLRQAEAGSLTTCLLPAPPPHAWCMAVAWRTARTPG
jgi:hypothetical protein